MKLTDKAVKNAKPKEKSYKTFDGGGLYLEITADGSKLWRLKYYYLGKEKRISLGHYPLVTLAEAREARENAKKLLVNDIDPSESKQERRREIVRNAANSFEAVAREWHEAQKGRWTEKHATNVLRRMETDIFPYLGARPISRIDPPELLATLRKIEARDALDIAARVRNICGQVFRYGVQTGRCMRDPSVDLKGALRCRKTVHFPTIEAEELPTLLLALEKNDKRLFAGTRRLIKFSMHTFVRPGEARNARWDEIDLENSQWLIPAERMKMRRPHVVPLSPQVVSLLREQAEENAHLNTPWVFSSPIRPKNPMSNGAVLVALKRMGYQGRISPHGFRALARTTIREKLDYAPDIIEQQLAHKASGALGEAYDRAKFLKERKNMMLDWSNYIDTQSINYKPL